MNEPHEDAIDTLLRQHFEGAVADNGFSDRVMRHVLPRRRRVTWPLWLGLLAGVVACWLVLGNAPLLHIGWRDWRGGKLSAAAVCMLLSAAAMAWSALLWSLVEGRDHGSP